MATMLITLLLYSKFHVYQVLMRLKLVKNQIVMIDNTVELNCGLTVFVCLTNKKEVQCKQKLHESTLNIGRTNKHDEEQNTRKIKNKIELIDIFILLLLLFKNLFNLLKQDTIILMKDKNMALLSNLNFTEGAIYKVIICWKYYIRQIWNPETTFEEFVHNEYGWNPQQITKTHVGWSFKYLI
ncbi:hypothetical protein AGLY_003698 [Aphis glycines]|uniref:Uncharacterized protein n=1 Tax=Aphis glycines TaxID=307491 RepID=A0A6G0U0B5_APHGL|nr:hypothetical protein AGLY_003698 [Aphis glycines]